MLLCDYSAGGFRPPEMVKRRSAVLISPRLPRRDAMAIGMGGPLPRDAMCLRHRTRLGPPQFAPEILQGRLSGCNIAVPGSGERCTLQSSSCRPNRWVFLAVIERVLYAGQNACQVNILTHRAAYLLQIRLDVIKKD